MFQIGSVAQNKNLETPEILESLKTLNFACEGFVKLSNTLPKYDI